MIYLIRFHPLVARDLDDIAHWIIDYAGPEAAARKLAEIEAAIATLRIPRKMGIYSTASRAAIPREGGQLI